VVTQSASCGPVHQNGPSKHQNMWTPLLLVTFLTLKGQDQGSDVVFLGVAVPQVVRFTSVRDQNVLSDTSVTLLHAGD